MIREQKSAASAHNDAKQTQNEIKIKKCQCSRSLGPCFLLLVFLIGSTSASAPPQSLEEINKQLQAKLEEKTKELDDFGNYYVLLWQRIEKTYEEVTGNAVSAKLESQLHEMLEEITVSVKTQAGNDPLAAEFREKNSDISRLQTIMNKMWYDLTGKTVSEGSQIVGFKTYEELANELTQAMEEFKYSSKDRTKECLQLRGEIERLKENNERNSIMASRQACERLMKLQKSAHAVFEYLKQSKDCARVKQKIAENGLSITQFQDNFTSLFDMVIENGKFDTTVKKLRFKIDSYKSAVEGMPDSAQKKKLMGLLGVSQEQDDEKAQGSPGMTSDMGLHKDRD